MSIFELWYIAKKIIFGIEMRIFMLFACARVSTKEQNLERQIQKFMTLGIDSRYIL